MKSRTLRVVLGIIGTIFLGAIGSGLWEVFLRHVFTSVSDSFLSLVSTLFRGYIDDLYSRVSRNPAVSISYLPYLIIVVSFIIGPWLYVWYALRDVQKLNARITTHPTENAPEQIVALLAKLRRLVLRLGIPVALLSSIVYTERAVGDLYAIRAALFIERSIEIVSPTMDEKERLQLRSEFRGVETARDFYILEDRLRTIAKQRSLTLPTFTSIK